MEAMPFVSQGAKYSNCENMDYCYYSQKKTKSAGAG